MANAQAILSEIAPHLGRNPRSRAAIQSIISNTPFTSARWVDEKVSGMTLRAGGSSPTRTQVEGGTGIYGTGFNANEDSDFTLQFQHGTAHVSPFIYVPHMHISPTSVAGGNTVTFQIKYQIAPLLGFYSGTIVTLNATATVTQTQKHYLLSFGEVTNNLLSGADSVVVRGNIKCTVNNTGGRVIVDSVDFHIPIDTIGSTAERGD